MLDRAVSDLECDRLAGEAKIVDIIEIDRRLHLYGDPVVAEHRPDLGEVQAGRARMVDVGDKPLMNRRAVATGTMYSSTRKMRSRSGWVAAT